MKRHALHPAAGARSSTKAFNTRVVPVVCAIGVGVLALWGFSRKPAEATRIEPASASPPAARLTANQLDVWGSVFDAVDLPRLLVVSVGGVGTTSLMGVLSTELGNARVELNDINDGDGLKHAPFGPASRGAVVAFDPTVILYIIGDPVAALLSHFRRGWPDSQLCKLRPADAGAQLTRDAALRDAVINGSGVDAFERYARLVAERVTAGGGAGADPADPFSVWDHAASWVAGAAELRRPVLFATLETAVTVQGALVGLLGPSAAGLQPLARFQQVRRRSSRPPSLPAPFTALYSEIHSRLLRELDGRCAGGVAACAGSGLAPVQLQGMGGEAALSLPTTLQAGAASGASKQRLPLRAIADAWARRVKLLPGLCGDVLRPRWRRFNNGGVAGGGGGSARTPEELEELVQSQPAFVAHARREAEEAARERKRVRALQTAPIAFRAE